MIIIMYEDNQHTITANKLANFYKVDDIPERVEVFGPGCFDNIDPNDTRITFIGHANNINFGEYTDERGQYQGGYSAQEFVNKLFEYGLPEQFKTIDVVGCQVGFIQNGSSYMHQFKSILEARLDSLKRDKNISINAPTNMTYPNLRSMTVATKKPGSETSSPGFIGIYGMENTQQNVDRLNQIDQAMDEFEKSKNNIKFKHKFYTNLKNNAKTPESAEKHQAKLDEIRDEIERYKNLKKERSNLAKSVTIFEADNLRQALDTHHEFHFGFVSAQSSIVNQQQPTNNPAGSSSSMSQPSERTNGANEQESNVSPFSEGVPATSHYSSPAKKNYVNNQTRIQADALAADKLQDEMAVIKRDAMLESAFGQGSNTAKQASFERKSAFAPVGTRGYNIHKPTHASVENKNTTSKPRW